MRRRSAGLSPVPSTTVPEEQNQPPVPEATASRGGRPPPSVFVGSAPSRSSRPFATKAPPSPFAQKPRSSSVTSVMYVNVS